MKNRAKSVLPTHFEIVTLGTEHSFDEDQNLLGVNTNRSRNAKKRPISSPAISPDETVQNISPYKYKQVWQRAMFRLKFRKALNILNDDILVYGTTTEIFDLTNYKGVLERREIKRKQSILELQVPWYIIRPTSPFKCLWNGIMFLLLIYTATLMPYRIAFEEQIFFDGFTIFEITMDFLFFIDVILNLFSSFPKANGDIETRLSKIAIPYLRTWFIMDLLGSFPFSFVQYLTWGATEGDQTGRANSFARVARLPRLYKIFNIFRLGKVSRIYRGNAFFERLKDYVSVNGRIFRLLKLLISILICVHFIACFWYFAARLDDFPYDSWIVMGGFADKEVGSKYLASFYWAFTTVSTVGYGDIHAYNDTEMIMAIICMMVGAGFYSMIVSSITSLMSSLDDAQLELSSKLLAATSFGKETGLTKQTLYKVRQMIKYNASQGSIDNNAVFEELPKALKYEVAMAMHKGFANEIALLIGKDQSFVVSVMTLLRPIRLDDDEILYNEGSLPDEFYVIMSGRVNLVLIEFDFAYKSFLKGSYIGEFEIIKNIPRVNTAQAFGNAELLVLSKAQFLQLLHDFPNEAVDIRKLADERHRKCLQSKQDAKDLLRSKAKFVEDNVLERKAERAETFK
jgi:hyperpolarization activated cyclic nucleotide-gated potassium channel 1